MPTYFTPEEFESLGFMVVQTHPVNGGLRALMHFDEKDRKRTSMYLIWPTVSAGVEHLTSSRLPGAAVVTDNADGSWSARVEQTKDAPAIGQTEYEAVTKLLGR